MADVEKRNLDTRPKVGDIVEVTWHDHFSFYGDLPASVPVTAKTYGELAHEDENGFSITQTRVVDHEPQYPVHNIHSGQFIIRGGLVEIKKLEEVKLPKT
jgi:hypothetical protein